MADGRQRPPGGGKRGNRKKDLALVFGPAADGDGLNVLRRRAGSRAVEAGILRPLREGRAITGEVVRLEPRAEAPFLFDCERDEELSTVKAQEAMSGPPQVATDEYRRGWDAIWGRREPSSAPN
jgi:hypothetical protein